MRGGPFPTLEVSWDPERIGITAGQLGRTLLEGEPRIMTHAEGDGHSFLIRPVAMKPGEHQIVARRLYEVLRAARPATKETRDPSAPATDISGAWEVDIEYEVGSARHKLFLAKHGSHVTGSHQGWAYQGDVKGGVDGDQVKLHSSLPADGNLLSYTFTGSASQDSMSGDVTISEYGRARWRAHRQRSPA